MAARTWWRSYITQRAKQLGLDPNAVLAVAAMEGLSGGVGDGGHAFGPFQMNDAGGVLTGRPGNHRAFAESRAGIDYALSGIAKVARGLKGEAAVRAIVGKYERPKNPGKEISGALARLGNVGAVGDVGAPQRGPQLQVPGQKIDMKQAVAAQLLQASANGGQFQPGSLLQLAQMRKEQMMAERLGGMNATFGVDHNEPLAPGAKDVVALAKRYLGTKYVWGGASPKGFDCSGFVQWLYSQQGVKLPRTTYQQVKVGKKVGRNELQPGDIVFFSKNGDVHHEGMYIGNGQFIHAPHTGDVVKISSLSDPYYAGQFIGGRRVK